MTSEPVRYERHGAVACITIDNPPVNAASAAVRAGLVDAMARFAADADARAAVLTGAGRGFVAGADITEFGKPPQPPTLPEVVAAIDGQTKPVVCVLHGATLGGGLEIALGAHRRIALAGATLGLPEVSLGILPGAGGTQRLPRLAGLEAAIEIITSARPIDAARARALGIVDAVVAGDDPRTEGLAAAQALMTEGPPPPRVRDLPAPAVDEAALAPLRARIAAAHPGQIAQVTAFDAVVEGAALPFADALAHERALFVKLMDSPQRAALVHAFLAERRAARLPELDGVAPRAMDRLGVVGGGTMGAGIAAACLLAGLDVTLIERDTDAARAAADRVDTIVQGSVARGKLRAGRHAEIMATAFRTATDYAALRDADLVIEAVFEDLDAKRAVFSELDRACRPGAVLATNTSYLDIDAIADATARPADVLGLHFFSPAHVMRLLEVVIPARTAPDVAATGLALARRLRKVAVRAGAAEGFIGNRILQATRASADRLVLAGATPAQVDAALQGFGFAMGPYAVLDLAGIEIGQAARRRLGVTAVGDWADALVDRGALGRKAGRGYYLHDGTRPPPPNPEAEALIAEARARAGVTARPIPDDEIVARVMAAMVNEAARVVGAGVARRPLDVDVVLVHGYGFPRWRGGPMHWADAQGLDRIAAQITGWAAEDPAFWRPAPLLADLAARGARFADLDDG